MAVLLLVTGCSAEKSKSVPIAWQQFGARWPLRVAEGKLACVQDADSQPIVTFIASDGEYALNITAQETGYYRSIDSIHATYPENSRIKMPLGELIEEGLKLCSQQ